MNYTILQTLGAPFVTETLDVTAQLILPICCQDKFWQKCLKSLKLLYKTNQPHYKIGDAFGKPHASPPHWQGHVAKVKSTRCSMLTSSESAKPKGISVWTQYLIMYIKIYRYAPSLICLKRDMGRSKAISICGEGINMKIILQILIPSLNSSTITA